MASTGEQSQSEFTSHDRACMARALQLAAQGLGDVEPNPMVGCVISDGDRMLAEGLHERFGEAHAEVNALQQAQQRGIDPTGKTMYVTLEPCSHQGKTPPCADAVVASGVARVVVAMVDPFDKVAGRGLAKLREAGITVEVGLMAEASRDLNRAWLKRLDTALPWVMLKWAQTLDGRIATRTGHSQWISGEGSRHRVHQLRAISDAVMVGAATAAADDPQLTAREVKVHREARRVVIDPSLRLRPDARMLAKPAMVTVAMNRGLEVDAAVADRKRALEAQGVEVVVLDQDDQGALRLEPLLRHLVERHDATRVLVEGGGVLHGHLMRQGLADELMVFVAPKLLGDEAARPSLAGTVVETMGHAQGLRLLGLERIDEDVCLRYAVNR